MTHALAWLIARPIRILGLYVALFGVLAVAYPTLEARGWNRIAVGIILFTVLAVELARARHNSRERAARGTSLVDKFVAEKARAAEEKAKADTAAPMIDHSGLSVSDFDAAKAFYTAALAPLGSSYLFTVPAEHTSGAKVGGFGQDRPQFWINDVGAQTPPLHFAFTAATRAQVDAFYAAALAAGGTDNGAPGLRPHYHEHYYGAFVLDPDGNNIEAVCHSPP